MSQTSELGAFQRPIKIIYFAMFIVVGLYWMILETVFRVLEERDLGVVKTALTLTAGASAAGVLYVRLSRIPPLLADTRAEPARLLAQLRAYYILCFALSEAVALYGFVLRALGASRVEAAPFFIAAVFLFLLCYPRSPEQLSRPGPVG